MIELQDIQLTYRGRGAPVDALRGIDLSVSAGEVFGIIGRSGAGKSSLVRVVNLLNRPSGGRVIVDGQDLTALDAAGLRRARQRIGMVFQHFNLLASRTVRDNVALPLELAGLPRDEIRARVEPLLELVGLAEQADRYPAQISGGQKQRVGIARALANRPAVLLSDEATSALDPETTRSILALLRRINQELGLTVLLITHEMQVVKQVCDRVAVIDAGRIVEMGPVLDVFTRPRHATTRALVEDVVPQSLPASVVERIQALAAAPAAGQGQRVLRLAFAGTEHDRPVLSDLARRFELDINLLHGQIDEVQGRPFGSFAVLARGAADSLAQGIAHLRAQGVAVEEVSHVA